MGLFDMFKRRRDRESATHGLSLGDQPSQQVKPMSAGGGLGRPAQTTPTQQQGFDLNQLGQIGALIAQAAQQGDIQVHQGTPQEIDLRGTGLREEILGIMAQHGIDAGGGAQQIDAGTVPEMQQQILEALSQHGVDVPGDAAGGFDPGSLNAGSFDPGNVDSGGSGFGGGDSGGGDSGGGGGDSGGDSGGGGSD